MRREKKVWGLWWWALRGTSPHDVPPAGAGSEGMHRGCPLSIVNSGIGEDTQRFAVEAQGRCHMPPMVVLQPVAV